MNANELAKRIVKTALVNGEWCLGLDLPVGGIWEGCESKEHAEACAARIRPALAQAVDQVVSWRVREILRGPRIIYLASPYSHPLPEVRDARFRTVCRVAARLMREGAIVFSPIAHSHPIAMAGKLPTDWTYWDRYDRAMLEVSAELVVLRLDGWQHSTGVVAEIDIATHLGLPIRYFDPLPEEVEELKTADDEATAAIEDTIRAGYKRWWTSPGEEKVTDAIIAAVRPLLGEVTPANNVPVCFWRLFNGRTVVSIDAWKSLAVSASHLFIAEPAPVISAYQSPDDEAADADRQLPDRFDTL